MALSREDIAAVQGLASRLKVDPGTLGGLFEMESGMNPNIWGGAGGKYRGLIQFGPEARKEVGLPSGPMSVAQQIPFVERYFQQRGFQPGKHGATELYRTVLVGNPHQGGTDSWGTNSDKAAQRMLPGGDLYERAAKKLGGGGGGATAASPAAMTTTATSGGGSDPLLAGFEGYLKSITGGRAGQMAMAGADNPLLTAIPGVGFAEVMTGLQQAPSQRMAAGMGFFNSMLGSLGIDGGAVPAAAAGAALGGVAQSPGQQFLDSVMGVLGTEQAAAATPVASSAAGSSTSAPTSGRSIGIVDLGKRLQAAGLKVAEQSAFGPVGGHSRGSLHYDDKALDVTDWQDPGESQKSWGPRKEFLGQKIQSILGSSGEVFGPHNDKAGHGTHIHIGLPTGMIDEAKAAQIVAARQEALKRFPLRWAG